MKKRQSGFTLLEMMITLVVLAALGLIVRSNQMISAQQNSRANIERQHENNRMVAAALYDIASQSKDGGLPAPYNGDGWVSAPADTSTFDGKAPFLAAGLSDDTINHDGSGLERQRVYQRLAGLTSVEPVHGLTGDKVTLEYELGVVYATECGKGVKPCSNTVPGDSPELTTSNMDTWTVQGDDMRPVWINSHPLQKDLLDNTIHRVRTIIEKGRALYQQRQLTASPGNPENFHPKPNNPSATTTLGGFCHGGWYDLSASNVDLLSQLNLSKKEYSTTAWDVSGNKLEFCRDYDPGSTGADTPPHSAAVRFKANPRKPGSTSQYIIFSY